jgi:hydrogenase maturation protease
LRRIVCIGNRFLELDAAGPRVYDRLCESGVPRGVEVIDGGVAGLDLLCFLDGAERVVFVDSVRGFGERGEVLIVDPAEANPPAAYDHASGLAYLLGTLPALLGARGPEVLVLGVEVPADDLAVERAAALGLDLALRGKAACAQARAAEDGR